MNNGLLCSIETPLGNNEVKTIQLDINLEKRRNRKEQNAKF